MNSYIVRDEIFLISVFVFQSVLNKVLSSVVSPPFLFDCLSVCLYRCLCVKYFCLNGFNFNPIIVEISYTKRTGMLECRLYMNITTKDSY